jgi:thioredoxin reductase (NADPH)
MRPLRNQCEVAVIGGGLAGLSAACHMARLGRLVTLFEASYMFGGLVATVDEVHGLSVPGKFSGQDLAVHLLEEARKAAVQIIEAGVETIETGATLRITDAEGREYRPEVIIVASGASLRKLGVPGEEEFLGRGVSRCATCDGGFFRGQDVVVTGSGDAAVEEALVLAKICRRVIMVCRSALKAKREYVDKIASRDNVTFIWDSQIVEVLGENGVSGVRVRNVKTDAVSDVECSGLFPFIGVAPNTGFLPSGLLTNTGHVETAQNFCSAEPRIFAAGAVRKEYGGNILQAMAEGVGAAEAALRQLQQIS